MAYLMLGRYKATPPTVADGDYIELLTDANGRLSIAVASIAAGDNNIGNVDVASIAAGDNNIGNVDIASAVPAGTAEIGKVRVTDGTDELAVAADGSINVAVDSLPAIPAGTNEIGKVTTNIPPPLQWPPISGDGRSLLYGAITQGAAGTTALVAADADELYYVVSYVVVLDAAGSFKFTDGTADLTGVVPTDANGGVAAIGLYPLFKTQAVNRALNIVTVTGKAFGHFTYYKATS